MITLTTETLNPTLRKILEENQQPDFLIWLQEYLESFVQFLISAIATAFIIALAIWGFSRIVKYWKSDAIRSHEVQRWLQVEASQGIKTLESKVNWIVKGSTVRFHKNQVIIRVPTKAWWQLYETIDCQREVRKRLDSTEFRELLSTHYSGYRFGDIIANRNCYILKGEAY
ncbi:hypothetical protein [Lactobacillus gigeriorum]|nr:hypothetical protein [Lactobacillus gigeriorum]CCI86269.1 Putative uncharacterized protein [Lactobacillus gigeriorum DSM 23908 = CRBIP 24.85]